jgi:surfeit locus 1 family protein
MFSRRWILLTVLALAGAAVCIRLGIWQLDRLEKRQAFNARVEAQINRDTLDLEGEALQADLFDMEYRKVQARGEYDFGAQIALRNQYYGNEWGVHLVTPLHLEDSTKTILVDRGWISAQDFELGNWSRFDEPGIVDVSGVIRRPQSKAEIGNRSDPIPAPGERPLKAWYFVNIDQISAQMPYDLLPAYIQLASQPGWNGPPYRTQPELELSEGPHMGYALQWFSFAGLLVLGYPLFVRRETLKSKAAKKHDPVQTAVRGHAG